MKMYRVTFAEEETGCGRWSIWSEQWVACWAPTDTDFHAIKGLAVGQSYTDADGDSWQRIDDLPAPTR